MQRQQRSNEYRQNDDYDQEESNHPPMQHRRQQQRRQNRGERQSSQQLVPPPQRQQPRPRQIQGIRQSFGQHPIKRGDTSAFKPKALSTESTNVKDDPCLGNSVLVEGLNSVNPGPRLVFQLDYTQFLEIVRNSYLVMTRDKFFQTNVTLSIYTYYAVTLLWRRLFYVLSESSMSRSISENFTQRLPDMATPAELGHYLDCVGNILDLSGREAILQLQCELQSTRIRGISGHFGRVSVDNHFMYETLPTPFVALWRIAYDYAYTTNINSDTPLPDVWDLPETLVPAGNLTINRNMLCYDRATIMPVAAYKLVASSIAFDGTLASLSFVNIDHYNGYPIHYEVLRMVDNLLRTAKRDAELNVYTPKLVTFKGSKCIVPYHARTPTDIGPSHSFGMNMSPLSSRQLILHSYGEIGQHVTSASSIYRMRVQRYYPGNPDCLCYTGQRGAIPTGWGQNADFVFDTQTRWNFPDFNGATTIGCRVAEQYLNHVRKIEFLDT